jgi:putative spermidine/putrescine transport system permease protein
MMTVIIGIFSLGLMMALFQSVGYFPIIGLKKITLNYYREVLIHPHFIDSLKFSLYISFLSSVIAVVSGTLLAFAVFQSKHKSGLEKLLYKLPIIVPHTVAVLLVTLILARSGILSRWLFHLRVIKEQTQFPAVLFDSRGIGIMTAYLWKEIPFIAMVVYSILKNIDHRLSQAAYNLGAGKRQVFFYIFLPLMMPTIATAFIIIFAFSFGAFEVPFLLGPTYPKVLPVKAYMEYIHPDLSNRPNTMVINMVVTFISVFFVWLYHMAFDKINKLNGWSK